MSHVRSVDEFWESFAPPDAMGCRLWLRGQFDGYGRVNWQGTPQGSHRVAWELTFGSAGRLCVLHRCDRGLCGEPSHLFLGTRADNNQDRVAKGRGASKYPDQLVAEIRRLHREGMRVPELGQRFAIHPAYVRLLTSGRRRALAEVS